MKTVVQSESRTHTFRTVATDIDTIHSYAIRWRILTSMTVVARIFMPATTVSEILRFEMFDLENVSQSHGVKHSQWSLSIANVSVYNSYN